VKKKQKTGGSEKEKESKRKMKKVKERNKQKGLKQCFKKGAEGVNISLLKERKTSDQYIELWFQGQKGSK
jgi:hypothetical protein